MERQFEGRSVAEAAIKACEVLGTTRSALKYRVVSETGELLNRRVVIAVTADAAAVSPARDRDDDHDRGPSREPVEGSGGSGEEAGSSDERPRRSSSGGERGDRGGRARSGERAPRSGDRGGRSSGERSARGGRGGGGGRTGDRDRGGRGRDRGGRSGGERRPRAQDDDGIEALLKLDTQPHDVSAQRPAIEAKTPRAKRAVTVVEDLVRLLGMKLSPHLVSDEETEMHIDLVGADEARMIGKKGEVLLALQFVVNRIISRGEEEGEQVVVLDAGGYRERRRTALQELAKRLASRAMEERKAVRLSPMSAHDRRVFHMTLKEMEGVTTRSEGDGLFRNLLIIPSEFV